MPEKLARPMKIMELGEFALIERFKAGVHHSDGAVVVGIGDDGAVLVPAAGMVTIAVTDMLIEGVHFDLAYYNFIDLGRKAVNVNVSDVLVMGGLPRYALLSLALPGGVDVASIDQFISGFFEACEVYGISLAGGDTSSSPGGLCISVTLLGEAHADEVVKRSGAGIGDGVYVTGTLGNSAAGLDILRRGCMGLNHDDVYFLTQRHLNPQPRKDAVRLLTERHLATSMIDISDGLSSELHNIARASGKGISIFEQKLPASPALLEFTEKTGVSALEMLLHGGEEYEVLFTVDHDRVKELDDLIARGLLDATAIGVVNKDTDVTVVEKNGRARPLLPRGYEHFRV